MISEIQDDGFHPQDDRQSPTQGFFKKTSSIDALQQHFENEDLPPIDLDSGRRSYKEIKELHQNYDLRKVNARTSSMMRFQEGE
jgi:hypothetical protein